MTTAKTALVTGAAGTLGLAISGALVEDGIRVAIADIDRKGLTNAAEKLGGETYPLAFDISDPEEADGAIRKMGEEFGEVDVLVNNAGITMNQPFLETTEEQFDTLFDVNMKAMFFCSQGAADLMVHQGAGAIINVSSVHARGAIVEHPVYAATKAAIVGFTRTLSVELIQKNVRMNCIASGWVLVENQRKLFGPDFDEQAAGRLLPAGFIGTARDIGRLAIFLASDESRYIIGETIFCDGGQTALLSCVPDFRQPMTEKWGQGYVPGR